MNAQLKKGVLELIVLESVRKKDMYGYELVEEVSKVIDVNEGTIYPLLLRMQREGLITSVRRDSIAGPKRKYYSLTVEGQVALDHFLVRWGHLEKSVNAVIKKEIER